MNARSQLSRAVRTALGTSMAASLLLSAIALGAEEPAGGPNEQPNSSHAGGIEEVFVTARRREESAQDVPIALSVVDDTALTATGSYSLSEVQRLVPSLQVFSFNPRNTNINIRGLGSNVSLTNDGLENGVGFYIDDVYYGRVGQSQFDLVDLDTATPRRVASDVMMPLAITLGDRATVSEAAMMMVLEDLHHVMIVSCAGALIGVVSAKDIVRWIVANDRTARGDAQ